MVGISLGGLKRSLQGASQGVRAWMGALKGWGHFSARVISRRPEDRGDPSASFRGGTGQALGGPSSNGTAVQSLERYSNAIFQSLAFFRFFSFAMGAGLIFVLHPVRQPDLVAGLVIGLVGLYTIIRVVWRLNPVRDKLLVDIVSLTVDLLISVGLVLWTGGLDSPFLIYSLVPILAASLLMDAGTAAGAAGISALSISGAYVAAILGLGGFPPISDGNYLVFSLLYAAVCFVVAFLPFQTNRSWQRHVRTLAELSERQRLRRDVHDNVAQTMAFLSLKMKRAEEVASHPGNILNARDVSDIARTIERSYLAVRDYLDGAGASDLEGPLGSSLATAARKWSQDTGLPVKLRAARENPGLPPTIQYQLLQIAREALANVAKHASPGQVWVELEYTATGAALRVRDDGRGFSASQPRGHGLNIMNERATLIGASLTVSSAPGQGTEVVVIYPYPQLTSPYRGK